jgi:hypothetical protein
MEIFYMKRSVIGGSQRNLKTTMTTLTLFALLTIPGTGFADHKPGHHVPPGHGGTPPGQVLKTPELNPGQLGIGLLLAIGGVLVVTGRQAKRKQRI